MEQAMRDSLLKTLSAAGFPRGKRRLARAKSRGFSLIEMMIVVCIIGILSALAIPAFRGYVQKSRMSEGFAFLGEIRQREEAYRAEFGQYAEAAWAPRATPLTNGDRSGWGTMDDWRQLGAAPDGPTRFIYSVMAAVPGTDPAGCPATLGQNDFSFCAQALIDLDSDGVPAFLETTSQTSLVFVGRDVGGPYLASGWE